MNVNGSRFHLLLGVADWGRCRSGGQTLAAAWQAGAPAGLDWDREREELRLPGQAIRLGATPGEIPFVLGARRAAAADRYGNVYWIGDDRKTLRVRSNGSQHESVFWPTGRDEPGDRHASHDVDFAPLAAAAPGDESTARFTALAVTEDNYLVVAFSEADGDGLLAFDLMAGGPPQRLRWPATVALRASDMAARQGGGVWLLDTDAALLWELDAQLALAGSPAPAFPMADTLFQPLSGPQRPRPGSGTPRSIDLRALSGAAMDPIAVEALPDGALLLLDRNQPAGQSQVYRLRQVGAEVQLEGPAPLGELAQDFVFARASVRDAQAAPAMLFVATLSGNQALGFGLAPSEPLQLVPTKALFPLRRFGGRALVSVFGQACYDSGSSVVHWAPVVQQPRHRYSESGELLTPVFDAGERQCPWDRLLLDARIPAGTQVSVWSCAGDDCDAAGSADASVLAPWVQQPTLHLRGDGAELPWLTTPAARRTRPDVGSGTWELLLQQQQGRYLQVRLRLSGPGASTPWLRALRIWMPRFSYARRFLPAVLRETAPAASFIDRFLANMEGMNTLLEDRIVQVQALFDPRCVPAEALDWLAAWFDVAFEPSWDEARRRLFIAHAMDFFNWRGTVHGLRLALALAFDPCIDAKAFEAPEGAERASASIRIVEAYQTRTGGSAGSWTTADGNDGLVRRYLGEQASASEQLRPFALIAPAPDPQLSDAQNADLQAGWRRFVLSSFGFEPAAGADERQRWQCFLEARCVETASVPAPLRSGAEKFTDIDLPSDQPSDASAARTWGAFLDRPAPPRERTLWHDFVARRYRRIERLNAAWQTQWASFERIALPDHLPHSVAAQADWLQFEGQVLAMQRGAHRFSVLLPLAGVAEDPFELQRQLQLARRIVELEKPAHTVFDVRFYWALNRIGEARLGLDTLLDEGSRSPRLRPDAVLGHSYVGATFVAGATSTSGSDRQLLAC